MAQQFFQHQHSQNQGDGNVALVATLYDQVKPGSGGVEHANGTVQRATEVQMRPPPPPKHYPTPEELGKTSCAKEACKAYPTRDSDFCIGHKRSMEKLAAAEEADD